MKFWKTFTIHLWFYPQKNFLAKHSSLNAQTQAIGFSRGDEQWAPCPGAGTWPGQTQPQQIEEDCSPSPTQPQPRRWPSSLQDGTSCNHASSWRWTPHSEFSQHWKGCQVWAEKVNQLNPVHYYFKYLKAHTHTTQTNKKWLCSVTKSKFVQWNPFAQI